MFFFITLKPFIFSPGAPNATMVSFRAISDDWDDAAVSGFIKIITTTHMAFQLIWLLDMIHVSVASASYVVVSLLSP